MSLTVSDAEQRGRDGWANGLGHYPFTDPVIAAECQDAAVGEKTDLLAAWSRGWQNAQWAAIDKMLLDRG